MILPHLSKEDLIEKLILKNLYNSVIEKAFVQAQASHANQKRDSGMSVLEEHIYPVTHLVVEAHEFDKKEISSVNVALALLHDALEDDPAFTVELCLEQFDDDICSAIKALSKSPEDNVHSYVTGQEKKHETNKKYATMMWNMVMRLE